MFISRHSDACVIGILVLLLSFGIFASTWGCTEPENDCCEEYKPISATAQALGDDEDMIHALCYNSALYDTEAKDSRRPLQDKCEYHEVDRFMDAAVACCAPLRGMNAKPRHYSLRAGEISSGAKSVFLPGFEGKYVESHYTIATKGFRVLVPNDAYTWCLLNANPSDYTCNLDGAREFATNFERCCGNSEDREACAYAMFQNDGACPAWAATSCCDDLGDRATDGKISKNSCEQILRREHRCVRTSAEECCYSLPLGSEARITCMEEFQSSGTCSAKANEKKE